MPDQNMGQAGAVLAVGGIVILGALALTGAYIYLVYRGAKGVAQKVM